MRNQSKQNRSQKGKRDYRKGKSKQFEEAAQEYTGNAHVITNAKSGNDPQWYRNIPSLNMDYANIPFNIPAGTETAIFDASQSTEFVRGGIAENAFPGIFRINFDPCIGKCTATTDAANVAAQQLYTLVRKANSGAINYDKTDLMMVILAMDSAYMLYEYLLRIYRALGTYNYMNRYLPNTLVTALGGNMQLAESLSDFRGILDMFAYKLASVNIPDQFDLIKRHSWMCSNVYKDANTDKAQMFLFNPENIYVWNEGQSNKPTYLKHTKISSLVGTASKMDLASIQSGIDAVMDPILGSQDVGVISGDIAKAFGEGGMISIRPVADYEAIVPVYDQEVLLQISNAYIGANITVQDIVVNNSNLAAGPYLQQSFAMVVSDIEFAKSITPIINLSGVEPTTDNVMVSSRLNCMCTKDLTGDNYQSRVTYGTEVINSFSMYSQYSNQSGATAIAAVGSPTNIIIQKSDLGLEQMAQKLRFIIGLHTFHMAPSFYVFHSVGENIATPDGYTFEGVTADIDNFALLDYETLRRLNETATMSLFAVHDYTMRVK